MVSSRDRVGRLANLLDTLSTLDPVTPPFEVVVCDDGSNDGTWAELRKRCASGPLALTAVRHSTSSGPAAGRNAAAAWARSPILAFTDDDCRPDRRWLIEGMTAMDTADIVSGRTLQDPAHETRRGPYSRTLRVERAEQFPTCNCFVQRVDFESIGAFDVAYPPPGGEDTDLAFRLLDAGARASFAPKAVVFHEISSSSLTRALKVAWRWHGLPKVARDHPDRYRQLTHSKWFLRPSHPSTCVAMAAMGTALGLRQPGWAVVGLVPWLAFRLRRRPLASRRTVWRWLPGSFVIDATEVFALIRGSLRYRTVLL